jgi:hypothetical protein
MKINPPTADEFKEIFQRICDSYGLEFSEETMAYLLNTFYVKYKIPFAGFHPKFIAEHVIAACNYLGTPPKISRQLLADSLENMVILPTPRLPSSADGETASAHHSFNGSTACGHFQTCRSARLFSSPEPTIEEAERVLTAFPIDQQKFIFAELAVCQGATWNGFTTRLKEKSTNLALICYDPHHLQGLYGLFGHVNHTPADPSHPHAIKRRR